MVLNAPTVSMIVLNYNGREHLETCLESLLKQTYRSYEILMVDNRSEDDSVDFVKERYPRVKVVCLNRNYGYAGGFNRAVEHASAKHIAILNPDIEMDPKWLEELVKAAHECHDAKILGGKVVYFEERGVIQSAGGFIGPVGGITRGLKRADADRSRCAESVGCVSGVGMLVNREAFLELGGFDEDYFMYGEEIDLCWRAWLYGYQVLYVPSAILYHKGGGSSQGENVPQTPYFITQNTRNRLASIIKNFEFRGVPKGIACTVVYDMMMNISRLRDDPKRILAVLRGYTSLPLLSTLRKRRSIQKRRKVRDDDLKRAGILLSLGSSLALYRKRW